MKTFPGQLVHTPNEGIGLVSDPAPWCAAWRRFVHVRHICPYSNQPTVHVFCWDEGSLRPVNCVKLGMRTS